MASFRDLDFPCARLPESAERLRAEVRGFLAAEIATGGFVPMCDSWLGGHSPEFSRKLGERGWLGLTWPARYGGHERSALDRFAVTEELLAAGAPVAAHWISDRQSGPLLLRYGTEDQRQALLPRMARGECYFAIGMSEPDAGSDLASVRTSARPVEGGWRLDGVKVWTSHAHHSHYMIALVRTSQEAAKHAGLSQLIVDLHAPGVEIRAIRLTTGEHHFNEVRLEDVFVPRSMLIGVEGEGWQQVLSELAFERSGPERVLTTFPLFAELARQAARSPEPGLRAAVGELGAQLWTLRRLSLAVAAALQAGRSPVNEAALVKDLGTRFERQVAEIARTAVDTEPDRTASDRLAALLAQAILSGPGYTLRGGTNEILRGIVARAVGVA